jgi:regulator of protease activity HflC (stomatin/prohibitin superfamily)
MPLVQRILAGDQERVLLFRNGRFADILGPGDYWLFGLGLTTERFNIAQPVFVSPWADFLTANHSELVDRHFVKAETLDSEVALIYFDGKLVRVLGPAQRVLYWRGPVQIKVEVLDTAKFPDVPEELLPAVMRLGREAPVTLASVEDGKTGLLYLDNRFVKLLTPGTYGFWSAARPVRVDVVDLRLQSLEIPGQEILTRDKVGLRVNILAEFRITDPLEAVRSVKNVTEHLYRTLQLAVRQTLGTRTLEEMLAEKVNVDESVAAQVRAEMLGYGVTVGAIALKDIVLPGDVRAIMNQVVTAEKQAQANLIRRREEIAATRSLLNTAKLMEDNPLLVRLKELETLEKVAEKVQNITVHGGLDSVLNRLITITAPADNKAN